VVPSVSPPRGRTRPEGRVNADRMLKGMGVASLFADCAKDEQMEMQRRQEALRESERLSRYPTCVPAQQT
jgi:glucokinase